jgi:hypothetical protein
MEGLTEKQYSDLVSTLGKQAADKIKTEMEAYEKKAKEIAQEAIINGGVTKEKFEEYQNQAKQSLEAVNEIARKQGLTINDLNAKLNTSEVGNKSIAEVFDAEKDALKTLYLQGSGTKTYMIQATPKGFVMKPFDVTAKAAGPHATTGNVGGGGNTSSIAQNIDAATLLRLGGDSPIISQYRNNPWIFDLVNIINAGFEMPFAMWYEEQARQGSSATVAEGAAKPAMQYAYTLQTKSYKKEAALIGFTDEFSLDFPRLQSDILGKGRTDLINRINTAVLANMITAATAYNSSASFGADVITPNDFDAIAAMAAQVDNATFGALANSAVMSTFKKYKMGITKNTQGSYLNAPEVLGNIARIGNPAMAADDVLVGDFKQYNIILRGGFIVRVGYNGNDFANNMFSVVLEQYYFDYISAIRAAAIVKGPDFATVKAAIVAP